MDFTKTKDDTHGVRGLISILRAQQDGIDTAPQPTAHPEPSAPARPWVQASSDRSRSYDGYNPFAPSDLSARTDIAQTVSTTTNAGSPEPTHDPRKRSLRALTFAQALPHLTRLSTDESFLTALLELKREQDTLERKLAAERVSITGPKDELLQAPGGLRAKAAASRSDREALNRWDQLVKRQQRRLEELGVPCFFETGAKADLEKQARIFQVLSGMLE